MKKVRLADYLFSLLEEYGVNHVFTISGGGNMHLIDALGKAKKIKYVTNHHEQACAIAAEGYARVTKNLGVCLVTTGPGGTNAITGVSGGWLDSIPMLCISGQEARERLITGTKLRQLGVQEVNIIDIVSPMTKYAVLVDKPEDIRYHIEKAVYLAKSGRPGPAWLDIPLDVQNSLIDPSKLKGFSEKKEGLEKKKNPKLVSQVSKVVDMLKKAKRPVLFGGHGIHLAQAEKELMRVAEAAGIPVLTSISAPDLIASDHRLFTGRPGGFGDRAGNFAAFNADLFISVGARLHYWTVGYRSKDFAKHAKKVMVDIDPAELKKKNLDIDLPIESDAKAFLDELLKQLKNEKLSSFNSWQKRCLAWREKYPVNLPEYRAQKKYVNYYHFIDELSQAMAENETLVCSDGTAFTGTYQGVKVKKGQQIIFSVGCAAMGYGLSAAIGASFAKNKKKRTILIEGDGSIMLNLQEFQTMKHYNLPIKLFLINNNGYLAIRNTQNNFFKGHLVASDPSSHVTFPDFERVTKAFGIPYVRMTNNSQSKAKIKSVLQSKGPTVCEVMMDPNQPLIPRPKAKINPDGTYMNVPLSDMFPFLPRDEYEANMKNED